MATAWKSSLKDSIYKPIYNKTTTPTKMKSKPEGKKKTKTKKRTQKKSDPPRSRRTSSHASLAAWVAQAPSRATQVVRPRPRETWGSREPSHETQAARLGSRDLGLVTQAARPGPHELFLFLSDLVSLSLIWSDSFSLSDLIRSGDVRLCLRLIVF